MTWRSLAKRRTIGVKCSGRAAAAGPDTITGIDVGCTFTDLIMLDNDNKVHLKKTPATPDNQPFGLLDAVVTERCLASRGQ